jgi:hypothetical protein
MSENRNMPYVKSYDAQGELINPILFSYRGYEPNRKARRAESGKTSTRPFSNKKGIKLVVVRTGDYDFIKLEKKIIEQGNGTRLMIQERVNKRN